MGTASKAAARVRQLTPEELEKHLATPEHLRDPRIRRIEKWSPEQQRKENLREMIKQGKVIAAI